MICCDTDTYFEFVYINDRDHEHLSTTRPPKGPMYTQYLKSTSHMMVQVEPILKVSCTVDTPHTIDSVQHNCGVGFPLTT